MSDIAQKNKCPIIYVNNVGLGTEYSYIGISKLFDKAGKIIARADVFKEDLLIVVCSKIFILISSL